MNDIIQGTSFLCGDNVTAYQIIAQNRWNLGLNPEELGKWAMEGVCPQVLNVEGGFRSLHYDIVVGGQDFGGGGKSIEHPIAALQGAGVRLLIADSFSRYSFRNAINRGLPAVLCPGISALVHTGDMLQVELTTGKICNLSTGREIQGTPLPGLVLQFVEYGGMLAYYRRRKQRQETSDE